MMLSVLISLAANQVTELALAGNYFELRTAPYAVSVIELETRDGGVISALEDVEATDKVKTPRKFDRIRFTNGATAQTIRVYYGEGETGSNRFTGVVSGEVSLDAATVTAIHRPEVAGGSFVAVTAPVANTAEAVFLAAANVNGAVIHSAQIADRGAALGRFVLIAKATAPATPQDGEILMAAETQESAAFNYNGELPREVRIAPGLGLYFISSIAGGGGANTLRNCRYTLL